MILLANFIPRLSAGVQFGNETGIAIPNNAQKENVVVVANVVANVVVVAKMQVVVS